jgi:hypothetical protein
MGCGIYTKSFIDDININTASINIDALRLITSFQLYSDNISGLWQPIVIEESQSSAIYCEPLIQVKKDFNNALNPCNCSNNQIRDLTNNYYDIYNETDFNCNYCCNPCTGILDNDPEDPENEPLTTSCDVQFHSDDFLAKVPVLNQSYISGFYDWKHLKQFPACNNPGLGIEQFISFSGFAIDWKLKETISEIPYDSTTSYHINEYTHNKSYEKSELLSSTCGNFILLSLDPEYNNYRVQYSGMFGALGTSAIIPTVESFTKPYGFSENNYKNIFLNRQKRASHWKWQYTSGIMGWYRYFDIGRVNDQRPIPGVDFYISPGDVFFAKNEGPEPANTNFDFDEPPGPSHPSEGELPKCPSGLKVVDGTTFLGIIPPSSNFIYISQNLYERFYNLYSTYTEIGLNHNKAFNLSALMCTSPLYDGITTNLLDKEARNLYSEFNDFEQIDLLNKNMLRGTKYDSANNLNYISNREELVKTLYAKYGGYEWIPPRSTVIKNLPIDNRSNSVYIDLDFDMVMDIDKVKFRNINSKPYRVCESSPMDDERISKKFYYDQHLEFGNLNVKTSVDTNLRFSNPCDPENSSYSIYGNIVYNDVVLKSKPIFSGVTSFTNKYTNNTFNRSYKAIAFNPHLDLLATHPNGGIYFNAGSFGENETVVFNTNITSARSNGISITFTTKDVGIKLYKVYAAKLQSDTPGTESCLRFPADESKCKCYGLNISHYNNHPISCDTSRIRLSSSPFFVPGLSTKYSPRLKRYGGYSIEEVIRLFGIGALYADGTPQENSQFLPIIDKKLDPEYPYECEQSATIKLTNYSTTNYYTTLKNFSTRYSDIYISIYEPSDLLGQQWIYVQTDGDQDVFVENTSWKRFLNKVTANNVTVYDQQEKILFQKGSNITDPLLISITNPFINALLGNSNERLSIPTVITDSITNQVLAFSDPCDPFRGYIPPETTIRTGRNRGDEISETYITIKQKPRKQFLAYRVYNIPASPDGPKLYERDQNIVGIGMKGAYHPNFGITYESNPSFAGPVIDEDGRIQYDTNLNGGLQGDGEKTYIFDLYNDTATILEQISNFDIHRKPRLLLIRGLSGVGPNTGKRYYNMEPFYSNRGGYRLNNIDYIGSPKFFLYGDPSITHQPDPYIIQERSGDALTSYLNFINDLNRQANAPILVPARPKTNLSLDYILQTQPGLEQCENSDLPVGGVDGFPINIANLWGQNIKNWPDKNRFWNPIFTSDPRVVRFYGSRPYFRIPEKRTVEDLSDTIDSLDDFMSQTDILPELVSNTILLFKSGYYFYAGPTRTVATSYIFVGRDISILTNYSNLNIDYKNFSSTGYVYNTETECDTAVELYRVSSLSGPFLMPTDDNGNRLLRVVGSNVIVGKKIVVQITNKEGQPILGGSGSEDNTYIKIYTEFRFRDKILDTDFDLVWPTEPNRSSVVVYDGRMISTDKDILLSNKKYMTKWGDLIKYDNELFNNPHLFSYAQIPTSIYNNLFLKQIVNDNLSSGIFKLDINRDNTNELDRIECLGNISLPLDLRYYTSENKPYYCIYQKYDLDHTKPWNIGLDQYQNYIPMMEVNFSEKIPDAMISGTILSSALYRKNTVLDFAPFYHIPALGTEDDFLFNAINNEEERLRRSKRISEIEKIKREQISDNAYSLRNDYRPPQHNVFFIKIPNIFKSTIGFSNPRGDWIETLKVQTPRYVLAKTILEDNQVSRDDVRQIFRPINLNIIDNQALINNSMNTDAFIFGSVERDTPFISRTIYADIDKPMDNTVGCGSEKCEITTAGDINLRANYTTFLSRYATYEQLLRGTNFELTYDAGTVNLVGLRRNMSKKIVRTMLDPDNPIFYDNTCLTTTPKPKMPFYRLLNDIDAQDYLNNQYADNGNSISPELDILDDNANEMLFRLLNGENQKINRKQLFKKNYILTQNELINFVEPEITAKEIYNQILYNYDSRINPGANISGSLNINGTKNIGDFISIDIYNVNIQLSIVQVDGNNVVLVGNIGNNNVNELLYRRTETQNSLIVVEYSTSTSSAAAAAISAGYRPGTGSDGILVPPDTEPNIIPADPEPTDDSESITLIATRTTTDTSIGVYVDISIKEGSCDPWREPFVRPPDCPEQGGSEIDPVTNLPIGGPVEEPPGCKDPCPYAGGAGLVDGPTMMTDIRRWRGSIEYAPTTCGKSNWYDPFKYGYCRHIDTEAIKNNPEFKPKCANCNSYFTNYIDNYDGIEGGPEFDYEFQKCSTTFRLKGHLYRLKFTPQNERPSFRCNPELYSPFLPAKNNACTAILGNVVGCWAGCTPGPKSPNFWHLSRVADCYSDPYAPYFLCIPTFGDPYQCTKVSTSSTTTTTRKVFKKTKQIDYGPYTPPSCAVPFVNISYTKNKVTVSIPSIGKTYCLAINSNSNCPIINIDMPKKYTVTENITSECVSNCGDPVSIEIQEENNDFDFAYQDYTVVCELGRISYGDLQGDAVVTNGYRWPDGSSSVPPGEFPPCGDRAGWIISLCGGGPLWYNCGPFSERNLTYGGWTASDMAAGWRQKMENIYNNAQLPCKVSPAIPTEDIIEGIIPGSCSLNFQDISLEQPKYKDVSYDEFASSSWTVTTSIAYITYTYRKAKTIQDHLISGTNNGNINNSIVIEYEKNSYIPYVRTVNGIGSCKELGFPPRFLADTDSITGALYNTFKLTSPIYRRTSCDTAPTCYYDTKLDDKQSPCNYGDWICWSTVGSANRASFLNRIFKDPTGNNRWV